MKGLITDLINRVQSEITVMKFGASADKNQFARVKAVITDLITWLQVGSLSEAEARKQHSKQQQWASQAMQKRKEERKEDETEEEEKSRKDREGERMMFWKEPWKDDVEGGQQETRMVVRV